MSADWYLLAACRGMSPELFYPHHGSNTHIAKTVCGRCPVVADCRLQAGRAREPYGIWGGLAEGERPETRAETRRRRLERARQARRAGCLPVVSAFELRRHLKVDHDVHTSGWTYAELEGRHGRDHQQAGGGHTHGVAS